MPVKKKLTELLERFKKSHVVDLEAVKRMEKVAEAAKKESKTLKE